MGNCFQIHTTTIMGSIQLGIGHAVGGLASKPDRDVLVQDFITIETTNFSAQGSQLTPAHHYSDFRYELSTGSGDVFPASEGNRVAILLDGVHDFGLLVYRQVSIRAAPD